MKNLTKKNRTIISIVAVVVVVAVVGLVLAFEYFHVNYKLDKSPILGLGADIEDLTDYIIGGDGSEEHPISYSKNWYMIHLDIGVSADSKNEEKVKLARDIFESTNDICYYYYKDYGAGVNVDAKFVKGSPNSYTYKLMGAPNGEEYIVTVTWKDKANPKTTFVRPDGKTYSLNVEQVSEDKMPIYHLIEEK